MSVRAADPATDAVEARPESSRAASRSRSGWRIGLTLLALAFVAESLVFVWLGRAQIDEGMFLTAGRRVAEGGVPYRDFPWSQGPTLPYVLAIVSRLFGTSLLAGRGLAWLGCLTAVGASVWIARRFGGLRAASLSVGFAMANVPALWVSTSVRTQAFSTPLVMLAAAALARTPKGVLGHAAAPSLLLWASGVRVTDGLACAAVMLFTAWTLRGQLALLARVAALVAGQALLVLLPVLRSPAEAWFHVATTQLTRGSRGGDAPMTLVGKLGFYLHPVYGFRVAVVLGLALAVVLVVGFARGRRPRARLPVADPVSAQGALLALASLVFLPHLALSHAYLTYGVTPSVLMGTALAIALGVWWREAGRRRLAPALVTGAVALALVANAAGTLGTYLGRGASGLGHLREVGRTLHALGGAGCTMVTLQTHLAVESGCRPIQGLEYSLFSYFRDLPDAEALADGVLNPTLLDRRIATTRPELIALSREDGRRLRGRGQPPIGVHPLLEFMPSSALDYAHYGEFRIPSGVRLPGMSDTLRVVVFVRRDRVRSPGVRSPGAGSPGGAP